MNSIDLNTYGGIALAAIILIYYFIKVSRPPKKEPNLPDAIIIFLGSNGVAAGVQLTWIGLSGNLTDCLTNSSIQQIHILIGGLAVIWASIISITRIFQLLEKRVQSKN